MNQSKNLHIIPGISGSGKTTMAKYLSRHLPATEMVVGYTTRLPREDEEDGVDYHFRSMQHFATCRQDESWRWSKINNSYYYNTDSATLPNDIITTKILPTSLRSIKEIVDDYTSVTHEEYAITIIPIIISDPFKEGWLRKMQPKRLGRNLEKELLEQDSFIESSEIEFDAIFKPTWSILEEDAANYFKLYQSVIDSRKDN